MSEPQPPPAPPPHTLGDRCFLPLLILTVLACLAVAYVAQAVLIPIVAAVLLNFLFKPVVRLGARLGLPAVLTALLIMLGMFLLVAGPILGTLGPIAGMIDNAPENLREIEDRLQVFKRPFQRVTEITEAIEEMSGAGGDEVQVVDDEGLVSTALSQTGTTAIGMMIMLILLFFLLAAGDNFMRQFVTLLPTLDDKKKAVTAFHRLEEDVSRYLVTLTSINIVVATVSWGVFWLIGMPNAMLWGLGAGLFNFVPYLGPIVFAVLIAAASIVHFESLAYAFLPVVAFGVINTIEAYILSPMIYGGRLALNPIMIFLALIVFGWLWGIAGALMAVPLLVCFRILCDHVEVMRIPRAFLTPSARLDDDD